MVFERYIRNYLHEFNLLDRKCWNYEDGCVLIGAQYLYEATGDEFYFESIKNFIDRYVKEDGIMYYDPEEYNIDRIPSGRVLFMLYEKTGIRKYKDAAELLMSQLEKQPRTESGSFWHKKIYPYQIWLDGLYMGLPFYMMYENTFGIDKDRTCDDVMHQFRNVRKFLYDEKEKLYYHAYDEKKEIFWADKETGLSQNFWSRAIGWYLMALADCRSLMPADKTDYISELDALLKEAIDGMLEHQDKESGLFYQLTALPNEERNYLETSSSCMVAYAILKGCRLGVFDDSYRAKGEEILIALETRMFSIKNGKLELGGMCVGAGLGPAGNLHRDGSVAYYLKEPVVHDEQKGAGAAFMAYSEWLKLDKSRHADDWLPGIDVEIYNSKHVGGPMEVQMNFAKFLSRKD